jgi:NAD(P)-dependent dehydrogenase (short-subunit alcohol dehydrogenase family)
MRIVVMGGTSGIGLAVARQMTEAGAEVIATGRSEAKLAALPAGIAGERVDATDAAAVAAFFERVGAFEHLVLAFSAGPSGMGPVRELDLAQFAAAVDGKLLAYLRCVQLAQVTESITLFSAASARAALPGIAGLAAVNGAVERMVSPLAAELAPVRVNAVAPGVIDTPWWSFMPTEQRQAQFAQLSQQTPAGRVGNPDEVADAVRYLIGAPFVTGTILPIDGGLTVA